VKKKWWGKFAALLMLLALAGCSRSDARAVVTITGPTPPSLPAGESSSVSGVAVSAQNAPGGAVTLTGAGSACSASVTLAAVVQGTGDFNRAVTFDPMPGLTQTGDATATLHITRGGSYTVTARSRQGNVSGSTAITATERCSDPSPPPAGGGPEPQPCNVSFTVSNVSFPASGGSGTISIITSRNDCQWSISSDSVWITGAGGLRAASGAGSGSFQFNVERNTGSARTGRLSMDRQVVTISQAAGSSAGGLRTIELSASRYTGRPGEQVQATAVCKINGVVTNECQPWFYSAPLGGCTPASTTMDPSKVSVNATSGVVTFVGSGSAQIGVQWSVRETAPRDCRVFMTQ